ncbi:MAG: glycosyltransferase [Gammaproteobacteria bacterium]|nr:glycosyltransferase [Gammaproteobacteria bacterium]
MTDTFVIDLIKFNELPWVPWQVIDSKPLIHCLKKPIDTAKHNIAMSHFGQSVIDTRRAGSTYVPLAYDPSAFYRDDRNAARAWFAREWEMPDLEDRFIVVMNSANMSRPSRKNFAAAFKGFAKYVKEFDNRAILYCHTENTGQQGNGENLLELAKLYGLDQENLIFPNQYNYCMQTYGDDYMRAMYTAADLMLVSSRGEGFCVPVIEAMACGCPVLATDCTALNELVPNTQYLLSDGFWRMVYQDTEQFEVYPESIVDRLNVLRNDSYITGFMHKPDFWQANVKQYEIKTVYKNRLAPLLERIEKGEIDLQTPTTTKEKIQCVENLNDL